jgi:NAD(P)-dependent dehydrogenase (short-subunit alcohol dehydrogenase family)
LDATHSFCKVVALVDFNSLTYLNTEKLMISNSSKFALITGASRGVGKEIAKALASHGFNLALHARKLSHLKALEQELKVFDVEIITVEAELEDKASLEKMIDAVKAKTSGIDILYNNAAILAPYRQNVWGIPAEDFSSSFAVNVTALVTLCQAFAPSMIERGYGRIINLTTGMNKQPEFSPYAMSKAAVDKYVTDIANKLTGTGVSMNLLDPGWLRTDLGGQEAPNSVESVLPGALVPAFMQDSVNGQTFGAQHYVGLTLQQALEQEQQRQVELASAHPEMDVYCGRPRSTI